MADEVVLRGVRTLEPHRLGVTISIAMTALVAVALVALLVTAGPPTTKDGGAFLRLLFLTICGGLGSAWYFGRMRKHVSAAAADLRVTSDAIHLGAKRLADRSELRAAFVSPIEVGGAGGQPAVVHISRGPLALPVELVVPTIEDGRRLTTALGLGAAQRASELPLGALSVESLKSRVRGTWIGGAILVASVLGTIAAAKGGLVAPAIMLALAGAGTHVTMLLRLFHSAKIVVGSDAVLASWFSHRVSIPLRDIVRAEAVEGEAWATMLPMIVRVHLKDGRSVELLGRAGRASAIGSFNHLARMHAETIAERINEAVASRGEAAPATAYAAEEGALERGSRSMEAWVAALRKLNDGTAGFRDHGASATVVERLLAILEDASASPTRRVAAAVALAPHLDPERRGRVRIAAEATAAPKLRVALEAAAAAEDDKLVRALNEVASEEAQDAELRGGAALSGGMRDPAEGSTIQ